MKKILKGLLLSIAVSSSLLADVKTDKAFNDSWLNGKIAKLSDEAIKYWDKRDGNNARKKIALIKTEMEKYALKGSTQAMCQIVFTNGLTAGRELPNLDIDFALKWLIELNKTHTVCEIDKEVYADDEGTENMSELQYYIYEIEQQEGSQANAKKRYKYYEKAKLEASK